MPKDPRFEFGAVKLDIGLGSEPAAKPTRDDPFRVVILGDFTGRTNRANPPARGRQGPVQIDRDNFDDVLAAFAPEVEVPGFGRIAISELDDFHPDRLLYRYPSLSQAREVPSSVEAAAPAVDDDAPPIESFLAGSPLESILAATEERQGIKRQQSSDPLRAWVDQRIAPHVIPNPAAAELERKARAESAAASQVRAVLQAPEFQSLEALWRAIYFLIRRTDTDGQVSIWLVDITRDELARDFAASDAVADLPVYRSMRSKKPALLVAAFDFGVSDADLATISCLGAMAAAFGASCIASAKPEWIGCERYAELESPRDWASPRPEAELFRGTSVARYVGLAAPRFLLRLPYGSKTDPCESLPFEEFGDDFEHDRLLWGNSAILCAHLLAESFNADQWDLRLGTHSNVDGLPVYVHDVDGESVAQPCAETMMSDRVASAMMDRGIMCVASLKDSDTVHLVRFQSAAAPIGPLAGPWDVV